MSAHAHTAARQHVDELDDERRRIWRQLGGSYLFDWERAQLRDRLAVVDAELTRAWDQLRRARALADAPPPVLRAPSPVLPSPQPPVRRALGITAPRRNWRRILGG